MRRRRSWVEALTGENNRTKAPSAQDFAAEVERLRADLEEARRKIAALEARADEDPLLPVLNRRGFARELDRALAFSRRYGARACLLYLDLDGFKAVNDEHGHAAGDALLRQVADLLITHVRRSDIIGRIGGDEFAVLLWSAGEEEAAAKGRQIAAAIAAQPFSLKGGAVPVSVSWGAAAIAAEDTAAGALDRADRAMYADKKAKGRR